MNTNISPPSNNPETVAFGKAARRLVPFLFLCYILAYLDRVNVGFAKLQMCSDLGFSETVYGTGAGIFFIGYLLFEVPSNMILSKIGARVWIARIMVTWGIVACLQVFVSSEPLFYLLRFLLGVAEAGFFPGIILYLTLWFPARYRARMVAWFMTAVALAGVAGGPISGAILESMHTIAGLRGWQWLFVLEGVPSVLIGVWVFFFLDDAPSGAAWLDNEEKEAIMARLALEEEEKKSAANTGHTFRDALSSPVVWTLSAVYFSIVLGLYGISFWLPQIIRETITSDVSAIGWISAVPWLVSAVAMVLNAMHSDRTGERRWHIAGACIAGGAAFAMSSMPEVNGWYGVAALSLATAGIMSALSCFWSLPPAVLSGTAAAAGIALINSFGNLAGYVSPELAGMIRDATGGRMAPVLVLFSAGLFAAAALTIFVTARYLRHAQIADHECQDE
ncbi:MAG: MFS transporter [Chlorobiaceae bacterium]|nr:MFS transporter [Chlorobiaceae bacterium]NTV61706.1 MFS transporter [Chlorobiaceae bacterium]